MIKARQKLDDISAQIVELLIKRQQVIANDIVPSKKDSGQAIRDKLREQQLITNLIEVKNSMDDQDLVSDDLVEEVMKVVLSDSRRLQNKLLERSS